MKIRINDEYEISSSTRDFIVSTISHEGWDDQPGKEHLVHSTFHVSFKQAVECVFKRRLLKSDATTLTQILNEIRELKNELHEVFSLGLPLESKSSKKTKQE